MTGDIDTFPMGEIVKGLQGDVDRLPTKTYGLSSHNDTFRLPMNLLSRIGLSRFIEKIAI